MYTVWFVDSIKGNCLVLRDSYFSDPFCEYYELGVDSNTIRYFRGRLRSSKVTGNVVPVVCEELGDYFCLIDFIVCSDRSRSRTTQKFTFDQSEVSSSGNLIDPTN